METEVIVLALVKESERFVFLYDDDSSEELLETLGHFAADTELSFTWYDAAVLSQRVRRLCEEAGTDHFSRRFRRPA